MNAIFTGTEQDLIECGFELAEYNKKYFIRYIHPKKMPKHIKNEYQAGLLYKTLYYDRQTKEIEAYNDYFDTRIPLYKRYIQDLIDKNLVRFEKEE